MMYMVREEKGADSIGHTQGKIHPILNVWSFSAEVVIPYRFLVCTFTNCLHTYKEMYVYIFFQNSTDFKIALKNDAKHDFSS